MVYRLLCLVNMFEKAKNKRLFRLADDDNLCDMTASDHTYCLVIFGAKIQITPIWNYPLLQPNPNAPIQLFFLYFSIFSPLIIEY